MAADFQAPLLPLFYIFQIKFLLLQLAGGICGEKSRLAGAALSADAYLQRATASSESQRRDTEEQRRSRRWGEQGRLEVGGLTLGDTCLCGGKSQIYTQSAPNQNVHSSTNSIDTNTHKTYTLRSPDLCTLGGGEGQTLKANEHINKHAHTLCPHNFSPETPVVREFARVAKSSWSLLASTASPGCQPTSVNQKLRGGRKSKKRPVKIMFMLRNSLCNNFSLLINSLSTVVFSNSPPCPSPTSHLISQASHEPPPLPELATLKKNPQICGFLSLSALPPCLVSVSCCFIRLPLSP